MLRRSFLKRMALAAAACAFIDVPWPKEQPWSLADAITKAESGDVIVVPPGSYHVREVLVVPKDATFVLRDSDVTFDEGAAIDVRQADYEIVGNIFRFGSVLLP